MPDIDPLKSLDNFSEGLHVNPLPASEVRRRGDRMRRRNTALATVGGVVAAAVFIGTPVALMSGGSDDPDVQPAPSPSVTEEAEPQWLTEIPAGFPVTEGMVSGPGEATEGDLDAFALCDVAYPTAPSTSDTVTYFYSGDGESSTTRTLQVWPDDASAEASLDALVAAVQACPQQDTPGGEDRIQSQLVDDQPLGEQSVTFAQQVVADDGLVSQLTSVQATRVGNAVLVSSSYGSAGGDEAIGIATQVLADASETTRGAMCVFAADPCSTTEVTPDPDNSPESPVEETLAGIPADFPLRQGIEPSGDGEFLGPDFGVEAFGQVEICGTPDWAPDNAVERFAVLSTGIEYREARELATFIATDDAVAAVQAVRDAVTACPADENRINDVLQGDTGYDSFSWGFSYEDGLGGGVFQLSRVGNAVLVQYAAGETSRAGLQGTADDLTLVTQQLGPQMCPWTADGCA